MRIISASVTTCYRPVEYLERTLQSLREGGFLCPFICRDDKPRTGVVPNFRRALWAMSGYGGYTIVFQDDVRVKPDLYDYLQNLPSNRGVFMLYLSPERKAPDGWSQLQDDGNYPTHLGACGVMMDHETAVELIEDPPFPRIDRLGSQLALWCRQRHLPMYLHSPSLIEHVGTVSSRER